MLDKLKTNKEFIGILICSMSALIFGLYPVAARVSYQEGANITLVILTTTFLRTIALYAFAKINKHKLFQRYSEFKYSFIAGLFQALSIIGIMAGSFFMPAAVVIVIMFSYSLMLLLFSVWRRNIVLNFVNVSTTILALLGLGLVLNIFQYDDLYNPIGIGLAFLAAFGTFVRSYIYDQQSKERSPLIVGTESFLVAFALLLPLILWQMPVLPESPYGLMMVALSALSLAIGNFGMFYGIAMLGAYRFSMFMKLEPVFTTIFGVWLAKDFLETGQYWGIALVILSLMALQIFDKQKK